MSKALVPVLAVVAAGSATFGFIQMRQAGDLRDKLAGLETQVAAQEKSLADALKGLTAAKDEITGLRENNDRLKKERDEARDRAKELAAAAQANSGIASAGPSTPDAKAAQEVRGIFQNFARRLDDPEVRNAMKSRQERMIAGIYDSVFKKLDLSEQDAKLVAELISNRNMAALDQGRKLLNGQADEATMQAVKKEIETTKSEYDSKLKGMLGEDKFKELTSFEQTVGDQRALDGFARSFERKNIPLQPEQRTVLADIMREERLKLGGNEIPDLGGGPGMSMLMSETEVKQQQQQEETFQRNVMNRAGQAGLSPDQMNALQESFKERNDQRTMGRAFGRAFLGGGGGGGGGRP